MKQDNIKYDKTVGVTVSAGNCTPACYLLKLLSGLSVQQCTASDSETGIFEARDKSTIWPEMNKGLTAFPPSLCLGAWRRRRRRKEIGCDCRSRTAQCYRHLCYWADVGACVSTHGRLLGAAGGAPAGRRGRWGFASPPAGCWATPVLFGDGNGVRPAVLCLLLLLLWQWGRRRLLQRPSRAASPRARGEAVGPGESRSGRGEGRECCSGLPRWEPRRSQRGWLVDWLHRITLPVWIRMLLQMHLELPYYGRYPPRKRSGFISLLFSFVKRCLTAVRS